MVKYQNCITSSNTNGEKQPRYRIGSKQFRAFAVAAFSALVVASSAVGIHYLNDIERRSVKIDSNLYAQSVEVHRDYKNALEKNEEFLVMVDNRNDSVAESLIYKEEEELTNIMVSSGLPNTEFTGYNTNVHSISKADNYVIESSTNEIVEGVENLMTKYMAYTTYDGRRTDLTAELFYLIEVECAKYGLDPYMFIGLIMTESRGNANAKSRSSTATGLCQILSGTAKGVYEGSMGNPKGSYNHSMAYDPALNIKMGITYLGELKQQYGLYGAIQRYRGKRDISGYVASINKFMGMSGHFLEF